MEGEGEKDRRSTRMQDDEVMTTRHLSVSVPTSVCDLLLVCLSVCQVIEIPDDGESPEKTGTGQETEVDSTSPSLEKDEEMKDAAGEKEKAGQKEESSACSPKHEEIKGEKSEVTSTLDSSQPKGQGEFCCLPVYVFVYRYISIQSSVCLSLCLFVYHSTVCQYVCLTVSVSDWSAI